MVIGGGAEHARIAWQIFLLMGGHYATQGGFHRGDAYAVANLETSVEPSVFDEALGVRRRLDHDIRAETAGVDTGVRADKRP